MAAVRSSQAAQAHQQPARSLGACLAMRLRANSNTAGGACCGGLGPALSTAELGARRAICGALPHWWRCWRRLLVSPSSIDGQAMREQRYCFNLGDGVCDEGPYTEAPCAVGSDEYDCRRQVGHVAGRSPTATAGRRAHRGRTRSDAGRRPGGPRRWHQSVTIELDRPRCLGRCA